MTLALTAILALFAYKGMGFVQTMFQNYNKQNSFISTMAYLNNRIDLLEKHKGILLQNGTQFYYANDTLQEFIKIESDKILIGHTVKTDTFHVMVENMKVELANMVSEWNPAKVVERVEWEVLFEKQKFSMSLIKEYDGVTRFNFETINKP